jgi:hypothetical protein
MSLRRSLRARKTRVCALSIMGATRRGVDARTRVVSVFRYRDGCQRERWLYPDDPEAWNMIFAE